MIIPPIIQDALASGGTLAFSISGGKDSQALARVLRAHGLDGFALHMDLGKAEWPQTLAHVERIARESDLALTIVRRPQGDLVDEIEARKNKLAGTGKPFWPSSASRYCTADQKRAQADKVYRAYRLVISAEGNRAQESRKRSRDPIVSIRKQITSAAIRDLPLDQALAAWKRTPSLRLALTWYALHDWTTEQIWLACGTSMHDLDRRRRLYQSGDESAALKGWPCHPAYVYGNDRLSCALCVLASDNDLRNGARHNPDLAEIYLAWERQTGITFKHKKSLADTLAT